MLFAVLPLLFESGKSRPHLQLVLFLLETYGLFDIASLTSECFEKETYTNGMNVRGSSVDSGVLSWQVQFLHDQYVFKQCKFTGLALKVWTSCPPLEDSLTLTEGAIFAHGTDYLGKSGFSGWSFIFNHSNEGKEDAGLVGNASR
jgi:hypothetical protein